MVEKLKDYDEEKYNLFVEKFGDLFQTKSWVKANKINNYGVIIGKNNFNEINISGLYVIDYDEKNKIKSMYFPKGPLFVSIPYEMFCEYIEFCTKIAIENECDVIRIEPFLEYNKNNSLTSYLEKYKFQKTVTLKFWSYTLGVDISNTNEKKYLEYLNQRVRYKINYAIKKGVTVIEDNSTEGINLFYNQLVETSKVKNFVIKEKDFYFNLFNEFGENCKLYLAYKDEKMLATSVCIKVGKTAYYIFGSSSNERNKLFSTYLLQFEMIKWAISKNCNYYDMGGVGIKVDFKDYYNEGLLRFKSNFGNKMIKSLYSYKYKIEN